MGLVSIDSRHGRETCRRTLGRPAMLRVVACELAEVRLESVPATKSGELARVHLALGFEGELCGFRIEVTAVHDVSSTLTRKMQASS